MNNTEREKSEPVIIIVAGFIFLSFALAIYSIVALKQYAGCIMLVSLALTMIYGSFGYSKPHGNMLRYAMMAYSLCMVFMNISVTSDGEKIAYGLTAVISAYIAGRLHKIKFNSIAGIAAALLSVGPAVYQTVFAFTPEVILIFVPFTNWIALFLAYLVRYKKHKEAGLKESR